MKKFTTISIQILKIKSLRILSLKWSNEENDTSRTRVLIIVKID